MNIEDDEHFNTEKQNKIRPETIQDLSLFQLPPDFRGRNAVTVQIWQIVQGTLFAWSPQFLYGWRNMLLRLFGAKIGNSVIIRPSVRITYPWKLEIGDHSWIGDQVELYTLGPIKIGRNAVISQRSYLCTGSHQSNQTDFAIFAEPIIIGDSSWIATDVFVAPGVEIGDGALVGARSSVFRNVQPFDIVYGSPATPKGTRLP